MGLLDSYNPRDRIYLSSLEDPEEPPAENKTRMLFCDARGQLTAGEIDTTTYQVMLERIEELSEKGSSCASICLDHGRGKKKSYILEIRPEQAQVLEKLLQAINEILEVPGDLIPFLEEIIKTCRSKTKSVGFRKKQGDGIHAVQAAN